MTRLPSHFYAMIDPAGGHEPVMLAETMLEAGARIMQLRLKDAPGRDFLAAARAIAEMCRKRGATLIVNDRVDIAILAGAMECISGRPIFRSTRRGESSATTG